LTNHHIQLIVLANYANGKLQTTTRDNTCSGKVILHYLLFSQHHLKFHCVILDFYVLLTSRILLRTTRAISIDYLESCRRLRSSDSSFLIMMRFE